MSTQGIHSRLTLMEQNSTLDGTPQDQLLVGSTHLGDRSMVTELQDMEQSGAQTLLEELANTARDTQARPLVLE